MRTVDLRPRRSGLGRVESASSHGPAVDSTRQGRDHLDLDARRKPLVFIEGGCATGEGKSGLDGPWPRLKLIACRGDTSASWMSFVGHRWIVERSSSRDVIHVAPRGRGEACPRSCESEGTRGIMETGGRTGDAGRPRSANPDGRSRERNLGLPNGLVGLIRNVRRGERGWLPG